MSTVRTPLLAGMILTALAWLPSLHADEASLAADEATLTEAGFKTDGPALLEFFRKRTLSDADKDKLQDTLRRLGDVSFRVREQATADLIAAGESAQKLLAEAAHDPDLEVARRATHCLEHITSTAVLAQTLAATRLLAVRKPAGATEVLLNYLPFATEDVIEDEIVGVLGVVGLHGGTGEPSLLAALKDGERQKRAAAALVLGRSAEPAHRAAVRPLLADPDAKVRLRAAQGLVAGKEKEAIPVLVALLTEAPSALAWQAEDLLCRVAGEQSPTVSIGGGTDQERRQARDAWNGWWHDHGAKVDLAHLDAEQRSLGRTLVVCYDGYAGQGKVWEFGPDRKTCWEITNPRNPIDAQVLPGNRVLLAEYNGTVSERDTTGKILWEKPIAGNPIACQRLPNKNTFVATLNTIVEITRDGKQVYSYPGGSHGQISCARKLGNGHIVYCTMTGMLVELDRKGKECKAIQVGAPLNEWLTFELLPGGHYLIPRQSTGKVTEYDANGKVVSEVAAPQPYSAVRLPNGNLITCSMNNSRLAEVTRGGKVLWEEALQGRPFKVRRR